MVGEIISNTLIVPFCKTWALKYNNQKHTTMFKKGFVISWYKILILTPFDLIKASVGVVSKKLEFSKLVKSTKYNKEILSIKKVHLRISSFA